VEEEKAMKKFGLHGAIAFCIKFINYDLFELMKHNPPGVSLNEGDGSLRGRQKAGCELTAPVQLVLGAMKLACFM